MGGTSVFVLVQHVVCMRLSLALCVAPVEVVEKSL